MAKILVVDDEPDITASLKNGLQRKGFEVDTYNDPTDALSNFKPDAYDLLLIDIRMPKMNGFEVYYDEFKKMFPNLEVKCFIRKPITINDLVLHINTELDK